MRWRRSPWALAAAVLVAAAIAIGLLIVSSWRFSANGPVAPVPAPSVAPGTDVEWMPDAILAIDFDQVSGELAAHAPVEVAGRARERVEALVVTRGTGKVMAVPGRDGDGVALRFPRHGRDPAALVVVPRSGGDLTPGTAPFAFGAHFVADGDWADGANVLQRGLFTDRGQYKLEVDGAYPRCSILGSEGRLIARSSRAIAAGVWYSADCLRDETSVTLVLRSLATGAEWVTRVEGKTGDIQPQTVSTQVSIGAKTWEGGDVGRQPDQFNGAIDNVYIRLR